MDSILPDIILSAITHLNELYFPFNILLTIFILCSYLLIIIFYKKNKERVDQWIVIKYKPIISTLIVILLITLVIFVVYCISTNLPHEPPEDKLSISISPFYYVDSLQGDPETPKLIKRGIEDSLGSEIDVKILNVRPIKDRREAEIKGRNAGSHFLIYGGEKKLTADVKLIEYFIIPTNPKMMQQEQKLLEKKSDSLRHSYSINTANTIVITDSLSGNVTSVVCAICALHYYQKSEYKSAIDKFEMVKNYENDDSILFYISNCYCFMGELNESLTYLNKAIDINSTSCESWNNRGNTLLLLKDYDEALRAFDEATKANPDSWDAWSGKGVSLLCLKCYEEALEAFNKAIQINPDDCETWSNKGVALASLGKYEEAIKAYDEAIEINPNHSDVWNNKGVALDNLGRSEEAVQAFEKAIEINPNYLNAWYNKLTVFEKLNRPEEATQAFQNSIKNNSNHINNANNYDDNTPNFSNNIYDADSNITREVSTINLGSDVNKDGTVNIKDLTLVGSHYGEITEPSYSDWDVNQDGVVNILDITNVSRVYGQRDFLYDIVVLKKPNL